MEIFHSVILDEDKCQGCTNCIKHCPTEAIRVRKGKARIINLRCIDCGECIRACQHDAKKALTDALFSLKEFEYCIALPAPTLYGQFPGAVSPGVINGALRALGFDQVYEVARGADYCTMVTKEFLRANPTPRPLINSACPAVVRLIQVLFPGLVNLILPLETPAEIAAQNAKKEVLEREPGIKVGTFFITPCPAKVTAHQAPEGNPFSQVDRNIAISTVYGPLLKAIKNGAPEENIKASGVGIGWARSGGEIQALGLSKHLTVDGINEVLTILEELEMESLPELYFIELLACSQGCVGGPLTIVNKFLCRNRIRSLMEAEKTEPNNFISIQEVKEDFRLGRFILSKGIEPRPLIRFDRDVRKSMAKMEEGRQVEESLPGLDCGACGAPSCHALAEDIVNGVAGQHDCIFKLREEIRFLADELHRLSQRSFPAEPAPKQDPEEK